MTDVLNSGREVIPMLNFDTDRTLTRHQPPEDNVDLFKFGQSIENATEKDIWRQMNIISTDLQMVLETAQRLDDSFCSVASKREMHPYSEKHDGFVREMLMMTKAINHHLKINMRASSSQHGIKV